MRRYTNRVPPPYTMIGGNVAVVEESKDPNFPKGCHVMTTTEPISLLMDPQE